MGVIRNCNFYFTPYTIIDKSLIAYQPLILAASILTLKKVRADELGIAEDVTEPKEDDCQILLVRLPCLS